MTCGAIATLEDITRIFATFVDGQTLPIVGVPQDNIGRTARLDCYYGVPPGQPVAAAKVWIGLASYVNEESARKRPTTTVADEREAGATVSDVPVGQDAACCCGTTSWMLVANRGSTTVVVQVVAGLVREDHAGALLGQLADFALTEQVTAGAQARSAAAAAALLRRPARLCFAGTRMVVHQVLRYSNRAVAT